MAAFILIPLGKLLNMRPLLFSFLVALSFACYSQPNTVDVGKNDGGVGSTMYYVVGGTPVSNTRYVKVVEGSPYFSDDWMKGKLVLSGGSMYDSLRLRLDLLANELQYISREGQEMIATTPVLAITLNDSSSGEQYHFVNSQLFVMPKTMGPGWYQLLVNGKVSLYKKLSKDIVETKPYGSATVEQTIRTSGQYFIVTNNLVTRVKKLKDLPDLLKERKDDLAKFISINNLGGKSDADFTSVITLYNKLLETL